MWWGFPLCEQTDRLTWLKTLPSRKLRIMKLTVIYYSLWTCSAADPGFPRRRKLHENEENWIERGRASKSLLCRSTTTYLDKKVKDDTPTFGIRTLAHKMMSQIKKSADCICGPSQGMCVLLSVKFLSFLCSFRPKNCQIMG